MNINETAKVLWGLQEIYTQKEWECRNLMGKEIERLGVITDKCRILKAKADAYADCATEIMKIFPKYMDFGK